MVRPVSGVEGGGEAHVCGVGGEGNVCGVEGGGEAHVCGVEGWG